MSVVNIFKKFQSQPADDLPKELALSKDFVPYWMMLSDPTGKEILYRRTGEYDGNNEAKFSEEHEKAANYCCGLTNMASIISSYGPPILWKDNTTVEMLVPENFSSESGCKPDRLVLADEGRIIVYVFDFRETEGGESKYILKGRVSKEPGKWGLHGRQ
jgi:hypothetical protein